MFGTNLKLKRVRDWLGLSLREQDALLEYKPGRSATYERKTKPVKPSREHLAKIRDLCIARKGRALPDEWYFDGLDTQVSDIEAVASAQDANVPYVGSIPGPINQPSTGRTYKARVDFELPQGAGYYSISDGSLAPYLEKGYRILAAPVDRPGHDSLCVVESESGELYVYEARRSHDGFTYAPITTVQPKPIDNPPLIKQIVEIIMPTSDGRLVAESETGVTLKMLDFVLSKEK